MRNIRQHTILLILLSCALCPVSIKAQEEPLSAKEIIRRDDKRYLGDDMCSAIEMKLVNANGKVRRREFLRYKKNGDPSQDLLKFSYPNDIKDTGTLTEEVMGQDDIQYLYLPAAKKLRRVSGKNQSWMGSDMTYEDLQDVELDNFDYELLGSEIVDGFDTYIISMTRKDPSKSTYSKRIRWVRKDIFYTLRNEYYDDNGKLWKIGLMKNVRETDGAYFAWNMSMENVQDHHRTEIKRLWIVINSKLPSQFTTTRHLEKSIELYNHPPDLWKIWEQAKAQQNSQ